MIMRADVIFKSIIALLVLSIMPVSLSAQSLEEAQKAYNAGVQAKGEENIEEAITQFTTCIEACEYLIEEEEDEEAEALFDQVSMIVPKLYLQLGTTQLQNKEMESGLANVYKANETAGNYGDDETLAKTKKIIPQIHYKVGASKYKAGDLDAAITELDKAISVDPDYGSAYYLKAVVYKKKDDDEAFTTVAKQGIAATERSNDANMKNKISDLARKHFLKKGNDAKGASKYADAETFLNQSLEFGPNDVTALYLLAQTYVSSKKYDNAIETGNKAVENETSGDEAKAKIYMVIAEAQVAKGDTSGACATYKKAAVGQYAEMANYKIQHELKCN